MAIIAIATGLITLLALLLSPPRPETPKAVNLATAPLVGPLVRFLNRSPWPLVALKIVSVTVFVVVVYAGLFGTHLPERNLATVFVWNLWWPLVVVSVFFIGSAWCAICPWDALSNWLVRRQLWRRVDPHPGLNRKVPRRLRTVWPALLMFMGLTWLELGVGVTAIPVATASMALLMVGLSVISLLLFERKAFCRYFCPVGRTLGLYSRLSPIEVRSLDPGVCESCQTMECYNGSALIEPCPTHLTVGRFAQNTYCLSCGNCILGCPHHNVSWRLRPLGSEAKTQARPHWDATWFMLGLMGITSFHGVTMMPFWNDWVTATAGIIGESGQPIFSFTLGMLAGFLAPVLLYALAIRVTQWVSRGRSYYQLFLALPFSTLPLAFVYHLSHNLDHLSRETAGLGAVLQNPLGLGVAALTPGERMAQMATLPYPEPLLYGSQTALMILGFWLSVQILRYRGVGLLGDGGPLRGWRLLPMLGFLAFVTGFNVWLMAQEMVMRF